MNSTLKPLFIFSLPRSGSTLAQRILASHDDIATVAEPWILLPYLYTLKRKGIYAEYGHGQMIGAIEDLCKNFPNGQDDYLLHMQSFILKLYGEATKTEAKYFLDKTPRYHLVVEDIIRLFPEGKFIFLWRNPLAIIASLIETYGRKWNLYTFKVDLFDGLTNLLSAYEKFASKAYAIRYEDILSNPETQLQKMYSYMGLAFTPDILSSLDNVQFKGRMGDPTGVKQYQEISQKPVDKWKYILANPVRKTWCKNYLKWIGKERLTIMGYDLDELLLELDAIPSSLRMIGSDLLRVGYGIACCTLEFQLMRDKMQNFPGWNQVHGHI